jgi:hypothetical protein
MTPEYAKSVYRRFLTNSVAIRRYTGKAGPDRTVTEAQCRAWIRADPLRQEPLVGELKELVYHAVVLVEDLENAGFPLPLTGSDKVVFQGKEFTISFPDNATRSVGTELIAYNLRVKG